MCKTIIILLMLLLFGIGCAAVTKTLTDYQASIIEPEKAELDTNLTLIMDIISSALSLTGHPLLTGISSLLSFVGGVLIGRKKRKVK